jgi:hypothetical protein
MMTLPDPSCGTTGTQTTTSAQKIVPTTEHKNDGELDRARIILESPPDVLALLFEKVDALARHRKIDPELRAAIVRVAEGVDPDLAGQLARQLDEVTPAAVLAGHARDLIEDRPSLGAFPAQDRLPDSSIENWLREDPRRLRGVTLEVCRFNSDNRLVVEGVLQLAEALGIELRLAGDIVGSALRDARHPEAVAR